MINIKRIYAPKCTKDGYRILVDRLWPRGIKKSDAGIDAWWQEFAPSTDIRVQFGHDSNRWQDFAAKYRSELREHHAVLARRIDEITKFPITFVYGAKNKQHNNAVVLRNYVQAEILNLAANGES